MIYRMQGKPQIHAQRSTEADAAVLWRILSDSRRLAEWVPAVRHVKSCVAGGETVGARRTCDVELGGRRGEIVEECVDLVPRASVTYAVRTDSLGMSKMFDHYCFRISIQPGVPRTHVSIDTFYTPRNLVFSAMNALMLRRQFERVVAGILEGLCRLAENESFEPKKDKVG